VRIVTSMQGHGGVEIGLGGFQFDGHGPETFRRRSGSEILVPRFAAIFSAWRHAP
jgi:hypothetical protein